MAAKTIDDLSNKQLLKAVATMINHTNKQLLEAVTTMVDRRLDALTDAIADMFAHQAKHLATKDDIARLEQKFERMREGLAQAAKPL